jgi:predicted PurR-regulated permease PerM
MFRSLLFFCLITSFLFSSCGFQEKHDAQQFYNRLNGINDSLDKMVTQWHDSLDQAMLRKNYSELATIRTGIGAFISSSRSYVANTGTTAGNDRLKTLEDSLLVTQSAKVTDIYPAFEQFSLFTPKEIIDKNKALLYDDLDGVKMQLVGIRKAQAAFAAKYTLKKK